MRGAAPPHRVPSRERSGCGEAPGATIQSHRRTGPTTGAHHRGTTTYHLRATLLPSGSEQVDLWTQGGAITFEPQDGAVELAPAGGFVLPGLVDAHVHLTLNSFRTEHKTASRDLIDANRRLHGGVATLLLRDMGGIGERTLGLPDDDGLPKVRAAPRLLAPEGRFTGIEEPTTAEQLPDHAAAHARGGAPWVKIVVDYPLTARPPAWGTDKVNYPERAVVEAVRAVHAAGGRVAAHAFSREGAIQCVAAGVDTIEHGWGLDDAMVEAMASGGIAWTPTLCIAEPLRAAAAAEGRDEQVRWFQESIEYILPLVRKAHRMGVTLLTGTDYLPPGAVADEVALFQRAGIDPVDALAAASSSARTFLGLASLAEGAPADLAVYESDPRLSPELLSKPGVMLLNGQRVLEG